jgi:hypothetical protein
MKQFTRLAQKLILDSFRHLIRQQRRLDPCHQVTKVFNERVRPIWLSAVAHFNFGDWYIISMG